MKILVILGPTSTGKTDLAIHLAKKFNGELVACDSRQVYIGLDIGTGKLPSGRWKVEDGKWKKGKGWWEINGIKIWMYDVADPKKQYTVFDYVKDANRAIDDILKREKLPIIVGGTGFYLKALLEGLSNLAIPRNLKLRKELDKISLQQLQEKLKEVSPKKWGSMNSSDRQNPRRLVRAIEMVIGGFQHTRKIAALPLVARNDILKIGLTASREILYRRIDERVVSRIEQGMIEEVEKLHKAGLNFKRMRQLGLEYGMLADYMENKIKDKEELIKLLQGKIHGYARRQITWFKKEKEVFWFDITEEGSAEKIEKLVIKWYDK
ncbi:tRNA (adenosine(37)-N6)-dimethylallyltransferase MiaA [Candidatus Daviesbacteria bacterium]|nr:tRNA (adenosine(37)-N6)-dimethylallyltransferase MiaA [Candidatus Daviesbacteria bacterium]